MNENTSKEKVITLLLNIASGLSDCTVRSVQSLSQLLSIAWKDIHRLHNQQIKHYVYGV